MRVYSKYFSLYEFYFGVGINFRITQIIMNLCIIVSLVYYEGDCIAVGN